MALDRVENSITDHLRWWLALAALCAVALIVTAHAHETDFRTFYDSALSALGGGMYPSTDRPNHLTPFAIVLIAPLTWLPLDVALSVWTVGGAMALIVTLFLCVQARRLTLTAALWAGGACCVLYPASVAWAEGQVTWYLLLLVTLAWLARSLPRAGAWLALVIAIKPPLVLLALALPWPVAIAAGLGSIALTACAILIAGWNSLATWYAFSHVPDNIGWPINASLWGIAARFESGTVGNAQVSHLALGLILVAAAWLWWRATRLSGDRRWVAALLWALLVSPIGSIYYLPTMLGPLAAAWRRSRLLLLSIALLAIPMPALGLLSGMPIGLKLGGSIYGMSAILMFVAVTRAEDRESPARSQSARTARSAR